MVELLRSGGGNDIIWGQLVENGYTCHFSLCKTIADLEKAGYTWESSTSAGKILYGK